MKTKHWQYSKKTYVPDTIKGLRNIKRDHSTLTARSSVDLACRNPYRWSARLFVSRKGSSCLVIMVSIVLEMREVIAIGQ